MRPVKRYPDSLMRQCMTNGQSVLFRLVHHTQDNLASRMPSSSLLVCLACWRKGEHGVDDGPKVSRINQGANLDQFITVGFNNKPDRAYAMRLRVLKRGWGTGNGDKHPSWFNHLPGSLQGITTNGIEDEIDLMNLILEAHGGIVNDYARTQFMEEVAITCGGGCDDIRPCPMSKLDGKDSHPPCGSVDQDSLSCNEACVLKEGLPGRQS